LKTIQPNIFQGTRIQDPKFMVLGAILDRAGEYRKQRIKQPPAPGDWLNSPFRLLRLKAWVEIALQL